MESTKLSVSTLSIPRFVWNESPDSVRSASGVSRISALRERQSLVPRPQHKRGSQVATRRTSTDHYLLGSPNVEEPAVHRKDVIKRGWIGMVGWHPIVDGPRLHLYLGCRPPCHHFARLTAAHQERATVDVQIDRQGVTALANTFWSNHKDRYSVDRSGLNRIMEVFDLCTHDSDE